MTPTFRNPPPPAVAVMLLFVIAFALLPWALALPLAGPDSGAFACKVEVERLLADTQGGDLEFLLVRWLEGRAPAAGQFVVTVDHGYTAGASRAAGGLSAGDRFWVEGTLMDRETYFGEQYVFFGHPQLYLSQIKSGALWPSQIHALRTLYLAPFTAFASVIAVWLWPFTEEFTVGAWLLMLARVVAVCTGVGLVVRWRRRPLRLVMVVGVYFLVTVGLAATGKF